MASDPPQTQPENLRLVFCATSLENQSTPSAEGHSGDIFFG